MMKFFVTKVDDSYLPTTAGYVALAICLILILAAVMLISRKKEGKSISVKQLVICSVCIAIAVVMSNIKLFEMPMGGSVTVCSMLFITLIGYWYGPRVGIMTGVAYGLLQLIIDPYILSIPQLMIDYFFAFGALGISGFFKNNKNGLIIGYVAGVLGRYIFSIISGVVFFASYAPEGMHPFIYSAAYNGSYLGVEAAITIVLILLPPVKRGFTYIKKIAYEQ